MLCKLLAMLLAIVTLSMQYAMAENENVCKCCGCEIAQTKQADGESAKEKVVLTSEEAYQEWFVMVHPLLKTCYANSTWISTDFSYYDRTIREDGYRNISFLLKQDGLTVTANEMTVLAQIGDDEVDNIYHIHWFIHNMQAQLDTVRLLKTAMVKEIPEKYGDVNQLIEQLMNDLEMLHEELVNHIEKNGTLETFNMGSESTKRKVANEWELLDRIYNLVER